MPQPKNTVARIIVPIVLIVAGIFIALAVFQGANPANPANPGAAAGQGGAPAAESRPADGSAGAPGEQAAQPAEPTPTQDAAPAPDAAPTPTGEQPSTPATQDAPTPRAAPTAQGTPSGFFDGLAAVMYPENAAALRPAPIGTLDPQGNAEMQIEISANGAGILSLELADEFQTIKKVSHQRLQTEQVAGGLALVPMAAIGVHIEPIGGDAIYVDLFRGPRGEPVWKPIDGAGPGAFEAVVQNAAGTPVLRIERRYSLASDQHTLVIRQQVQNLSGTPYKVRFYQTGPVDMPQESAGYGGDKRRVRFGYLFPAAKDPTRSVVVSDEFLMGRGDALGGRGDNGAFRAKTLWPNNTSRNNNFDLVWAGMTSRYFGVAVHPVIDLTAAGVDKQLSWVGSVERIVLDTGGKDVPMALRLDSVPIELGAGASRDLSIGVFAGPLNRKQIRDEPLLASLGLDGLVVYNFGGPCGFCTFGWLTGGLLWLLRTLHDYLVFDWALAIILLVVIVRTILHPVTKWSQIRMQRFGKQMQGVAPKQKALQEKYKDDPKKLQQETAKLWREEGISPTGMLGCIPMFLQTPIWIALYATLYFAVELRHEPAFFGVFQAIAPNWWFLGDLAEPDRVLYFGRAVFTVPLLGPIESINILPLILGVVFFIQQKYLTPPTTVTLTPEQEMQQKIVKVMMVVMFPVFMYNAPSGLAIYFIANSTLGILESRWIRAHIDANDLLKPPPKKPRSGPTFLERVQQLAEDRQKRLEGGGGRGGRGGHGSQGGGRGQPPRKRV